MGLFSRFHQSLNFKLIYNYDRCHLARNELILLISLFSAAPITQSQATSVMNESLTRANSIPLLDQSATEVSTATFEIASPKIETQIIGDRSAQPFEEIPGPAVLKIWEKYWKFVPLFGTQLFSSLLINRFTQGTIC